MKNKNHMIISIVAEKAYMCLKAPITFYIFKKKKKIQKNKHHIIPFFSFYEKQIIEGDEREE